MAHNKLDMLQECGVEKEVFTKVAFDSLYAPGGMYGVITGVMYT